MQKSDIADKNSELFLFLVIMITLIVANHELINCNPSFFNQHININIFIYPFTFFIANLITKRHGIIASAIIIFLTTIFWTIYYLGESFLISGYSFQKEFLFSNIFVFAVSQIINLFAYSKILKFKQDSTINLILTSIIVLTSDTLLKMVLSNPLNSLIAILPNYLINNVSTILVSIITILTTFYFSEKS